MYCILGEKATTRYLVINKITIIFKMEFILFHSTGANIMLLKNSVYSQRTTEQAYA